MASLFDASGSNTFTVVTRDALQNVTADAFTNLTRWTLEGNVNGITSSALPVVTTIAPGVTLTQTGALTVERGMDIQGTVSVDDLILGQTEASAETSQRPASVITVFNGGVLEIKGNLTVNPIANSTVMLRDGGVLKTNVANLVTPYPTAAIAHQYRTSNVNTLVPTINYALGEDWGGYTQQGTWVPSFAEPNNEGWSVYDLSTLENTALNLVMQRLGTIALTNPHSRLIVPDIVRSNLVVGEGNEVYFTGTNLNQAIAVEGTRLELQRGAKLLLDKVADLTGPFSGTLTLVLHPESQIVVGATLQAKLTSGDEDYALRVRNTVTLETEASTLNREASTTPAWWALINDDIARYDTLAGRTSKRTLVTTGSTIDIDPERFPRWEVARPGENQTAHLATDTVVPYGKTLKLTMERLVTGDSLVYTEAKTQTITNLGTVRFDDLTLINAGTSAIMGGGAVEKVGSGTATIDGIMGYVGHTTVNEGTLKLRQDSGLTGNVMVKGGATVYSKLPKLGQSPHLGG